MDKVIEWLLLQGWVGLSTILLSAAVVMLGKEIKRKDKLIRDSYDARIKDAREFADKFLIIIPELRTSILVLTEIVREKYKK